MLGWEELTTEIRRIADTNGFDRPTLDNLATKVMMVVTEVDEALECTQGVHYGTLGEELADTGIRLIDILDCVWKGEWSTRIVDLRMPIPDRMFEPFERLSWPIIRRCCQSVEAWRHARYDDARICLEYALAETNLLAVNLRIDLHEEMRKKCVKNATRGKLHGKVRSEG